MSCPKCGGRMGAMSDICHDCDYVDGEPGMSRWLLFMVVIGSLHFVWWMAVGQ